MSDALQRLAPPLPPQPPAIADAAGDAGWLMLMACLALATLIAALAPYGRRLWTRRGLRRALTTLARNDADMSADLRAQALAALVRRFKLSPSDGWWREANAIRFGRPAAASSERVDVLIAELATELTTELESSPGGAS